MAHVGAYGLSRKQMSFLYASHILRSFALPLAQCIFRWAGRYTASSGHDGVDYLAMFCKQRLSQGRRCFPPGGQDREDTSAFHLDPLPMCPELMGLGTSEQRVVGGDFPHPFCYLGFRCYHGTTVREGGTQIGRTV